MLVFEKRTSDVTLVKLNDQKYQMYPTRKLRESQKLRNLQYMTEDVICLM